MGYMRHHTIVVTGPSSNSADETQTVSDARMRAIELFGELVSGEVASVRNGYKSFFIAPDGSKENWDTSLQYDAYRKRYVEWLRKRVYEDGSSSLDWIELFYGDGEGEVLILNHPHDGK
jgi:hypothetical protein